jgi:protein-S-isoprenylcysteine O-methyltransferase
VKPLVVHEAAAGILFWVVAGTWAIGELTFAVRTTLRHRETRDASVAALWSATSAGFALAVVAAHRAESATLPGPAWWPVAAGLAVFAAGLVVRIWAIRELGRFFKFTVVVQPDHEVVQTGPYRLVRHPSYTGLMMAMLGLGLMLGNWISILAASLPAIAGFTIRLLSEERVLARELGEPYRAYMGRTKRLVPGVW